MNSVFSEQILADKLSKLNSTQQCIETLSHWCIFHRKNAEQVVQTWEKQFRSSSKERKTPFLYLANDILQNSRRNGMEFVGEFWKVLPSALKDVTENCDDHGKTVVSRLVAIWEERRVFGSRARGLKDLMLGSEPPPPLELNKKRSRSVRIVKRDTRSIKIKLSIGGIAEKIVSAFHTVLSELPNEDADLSKCKSATKRIRKMEKDVDAVCARVLVGDPHRTTLAEELQEEEKALKECTAKLKSVEANRLILVLQLKEALQEQESQLENIRTQIQVAEAQIEQGVNMRKRLNNEPTAPAKPDSNGAESEPLKKSAAAIAAEVADKLAASTHSQQIMTSVLSTFAAEAAKNAGLGTTSAANSTPPTNVKLEKPMIPLQPMVASSPSQQPQYSLYSAPAQQYIQPSGGVMISVPYAYTTLPPPPPSVPQMMNMVRPPMPPPQPPPMALLQQSPTPMAMHQLQIPMNQQQQQQFGILQPAPPSFRPLQPPTMGFYHHQTQ
ncbi:hypothetical protein KSP39_PZI015158 [Platanthera zijinensis]|uniref:CID domain-containing protein n=1 Tax=Platanthera zijinensis TaxID=2320716 RepID=A0AAP0BCW4_9ASPA